MKKTRKDVIYDTDKDECLMTVGEFMGYDEIYSGELKLYRTGDGRYYFYGRGGAGTAYAHRDEEGEWVGGEKIIPVDDIADAKEWVLKHSKYDEFEQIFGESGHEYVHRVYADPEFFDSLNEERSHQGLEH